MVESYGMCPDVGKMIFFGSIFALTAVLFFTIGGILGNGSFTPMTWVLQPAYAQQHGLGATANCAKVQVSDTNSCTFTVRNLDDFGDSIRVDTVATTMQPPFPGAPVTNVFPAGGDMEIIFVSIANPTADSCIVGGSLPCTLPDTFDRVSFRDRSHTMIAAGTFPYSATAIATDLCNAPGTSGCNAADGAQTATASPLIVVIEPSVNIEKTAEPAKIIAGTELTYAYAVENTGTVILDCEVTDDQLGEVGSILDLAPGETQVLNAQAVISVDTTNTGTVVCNHQLGEVSDSDDATVVVIEPSVTMIKDVDQPKALAETEVTYTYTVENTGDVDLDCTVTDDQLGAIGGATIISGGVEVFNAVAIIDADVTNIGTVTCRHQLGEVSDSDDATVIVADALVTITKNAEPAKILPDTEVTYTYTVENTGLSDLENCEVTDDQLGVIGSILSLSAGDLEVFNAATAVNTDTTNVATVTCEFQLGIVSDTDDASVNVINPALSVTKECEPETQTAPGTITWTVNINNDGDVDLDVLATDDQSPAQPIFDGVVTAGHSEQIVYQTTNLSPDIYSNTVLVTGAHQLGELQDSATASCEVMGAEGAVFLKIDEDSIDNGIHFNRNGGDITPNGPHFFSKTAVNDDKPGEQQRDVLRYFARNVGKTITVVTGETGDEGWFAPTCIPQKWLYGLTGDEEFDNECLTGAERDLAIDNYFGINGENNVPSQEVLDKVPHVEPLRALGLNALVGKTVCAVVYDSDNSVNYDHDKDWLGVNDNMQGETLGIVAFVVVETKSLNGFSSSTLPQVTLTIVSTEECGNWTLFNAPVPESSSVPNDRIAPGSPAGYRALKVWPSLDLFF